MRNVRKGETENAPNSYSFFPLPPVLDCATAPCVRAQLLRLLVDKVNVRVDMSDVCTIDTAAIAVFVECLRVAKDHSVAFTVVRPPECALRLMRLTKVEQLLAGTKPSGPAVDPSDPRPRHPMRDSYCRYPAPIALGAHFHERPRCSTRHGSRLHGSH